MIGDFNGRTGLLNDIYDEKGNFIPGPKGTTKFGDVSTRKIVIKPRILMGTKL